MSDNSKAATLTISNEYSRRSWDKPTNSKSRIKRGSEFIVYLASLSRYCVAKNSLIAKLSRALSDHIEKEMAQTKTQYEERLMALKQELAMYKSTMPVVPSEEPPEFEKQRKIEAKLCCSINYQFFALFATYDQCARQLEQLRQYGGLTHEDHKKRQFELAKTLRSFIEQYSARIAIFHKKRKQVEAEIPNVSQSQ